MSTDIRRNPRVLAGEILEKAGAVDWTPFAGVAGAKARDVLTNWSAVKGALEQIKLGKISAMHVRLFDAAQEIATGLASIQEACENDVFEFHAMERNAPEAQIAEIVAGRKQAEKMYHATVEAMTFYASVLPLIVGQLIDYSPQQESRKGKGHAVGVETLR